MKDLGDLTATLLIDMHKGCTCCEPFISDPASKYYCLLGDA